MIAESLFSLNLEVVVDNHIVRRVLDYAVPHLPLDILRISAKAGCPLCRILAHGIQSYFLPPEIQADGWTNIRPALIDLHQAFQVCVDMDDVNHVFYFHVPSSFRKL